MEKKNYLILDDEFIQYCKLNNIEDIQKLAKETFNRGFTVLKYGEIPIIANTPKIEVKIEKIDMPEEKKLAKDLYDE
jgi:hypothetical protein